MMMKSGRAGWLGSSSNQTHQGAGAVRSAQLSYLSPARETFWSSLMADKKALRAKSRKQHCTAGILRCGLSLTQNLPQSRVPNLKRACPPRKNGPQKLTQERAQSQRLG